MMDIDRLVAIDEIRKLKARYFRLMDTKQWDQLAEVFAPDAVYDATDALRNGSGPDSLDQKLGAEWINTSQAGIIAFIRQALDGMTSAHHGHMPEIEIHSETEAAGIWAMSDVVHHYVDGRLVLKLDGEGHYHETYEKIDGRWMIKTSRLTRLRTALFRAE